MTSDGLGVRDSHPDKDVGHLRLTVVSRMALWLQQADREAVPTVAVRSTWRCLRPVSWLCGQAACTATANVNNQSTPV